MIVTIEAWPPAAFADACEPGPVPALTPGRTLRLQGETSGHGDAVDSTVCGGADGGADAISRFRLDAGACVRAALLPGAGAPADAPAPEGVLSLRGGPDCGGEPICGTLLASTVVADLPPGEHALVVDAGDPGFRGAFAVELTVE